MHTKKIILVISRVFLLLILGALAAEIVWGTVMDRIGASFIPVADALIRIAVVFSFFELIIWWQPGKKGMSKLLRHLKLTVDHFRKGHSSAITIKQVRVFQIVLSIILLVICFSQFDYLVDSAKQRHIVSSSNVQLFGIFYPNGLIIEFSPKQYDIDPINIQMVVTGNISGSMAVWFDSPHLREQSPTMVSFTKSVLVRGKVVFNVPNFSLYSLGYPLSSKNSLYIFIEGTPVIEKCSFNGVQFIKGDGWLLRDKR